VRGKFNKLWLVFIGIVSIIVFWIIIALFLKGSAWLGEVMYPSLSLIFRTVFWVSILLFLPLALFKKTRTFSGKGLYFVSWIFGIHLWITSFLITYKTWGVVAVIIGILIMGIGVFPISLLATLLTGEWSALGQLLLLFIMTIGSRRLGMRLAAEKTPSYYEVEYEIKKST